MVEFAAQEDVAFRNNQFPGEVLRGAPRAFGRTAHQQVHRLAALAEKPGLPVVFSGGVASNSMLRERMREFSPVFAEPQYSTDNAMGIAVLTALQEGL